MKNILIAATSAIVLLGAVGPAVADAELNAYVCNGECGDNNGNKNGWTDNRYGLAPMGLNISGANGRVDNGGGNGGENRLAPNKYGEDADADKDPN